jgi:hypothetical protein
MANFYKRPEPFFLLVTLVYGIAFTIFTILSYAFPLYFLHSKAPFILEIPAFLVIPLAFFWTIYQCVRYERHPWKYIAVSLLVPMGFLWYVFERYRRVTRNDSGKTGRDARSSFEVAPSQRAPYGNKTVPTHSRLQKGPEILLWLIPMIYGCIVIFVFLFTPFVNPNHWPDRRLYYAFMSPVFIISPFGNLWALYQCFRYEQRPWKYIRYLVIPFGFLWYYFERYRQVPHPRAQRRTTA